jgi:hypothetical protein
MSHVIINIMKTIFTILLLLFNLSGILAQPVFKNPGIPTNESFEIYEMLSPQIGRVNTKIYITQHDFNKQKCYSIHIYEGGYFLNDIEVKATDLTTISEKRTDLKTNKVIQYFTRSGDTIKFYNAEKSVNKTIISDERNIYSPLAFYLSFRGFPFQTGKTVSFKSYMYQYGGALTMNLTCSGRKTVTVKAGTYECYILELSVGGWQSVFAPDKYLLYFTVDNPHIFVKYEEKVHGNWIADELTKYNK